ncbi:MAG: polynucleotide adenylyltransferase, partial [Chloroflexota bacterium]
MNFDTTPDALAARIDALPDDLPILIRAAGSVANKKQFAAYLVGGIVRDLLLGLPQDDVDIVIEGHAASVARAMANRFGGHVLAHDRFGTATWTLADSSFAGSVVAAVDFITARRETYAHPGALPQIEPSAIDDDLRRRD